MFCPCISFSNCLVDKLRTYLTESSSEIAVSPVSKSVHEIEDGSLTSWDDLTTSDHECEAPGPSAWWGDAEGTWGWAEHRAGPVSGVTGGASMLPGRESGWPLVGPSDVWITAEPEVLSAVPKDHSKDT